MNDQSSSTPPIHLQVVNQHAANMHAYEQAIADWHVLLWSQSQNAFHIEPHSRMLASNRRAYAEDRRMDFVELFVGPHEACCDMADKLRGTITHRDTARLAAGETIRSAREAR